MRKGSTTTNSVPAYLLRAQALHQRFHCYVYHIDFIKGEHNDISDIPSRKPNWSAEEQNTLSTVAALENVDPATRNDVLYDFLLAQEDFSKKVTPGTANSIKLYRSYWAIGSNSAAAYPKNLFSLGAKTPSSALPHQQKAILPYGLLAKRVLVWGPKTHASTKLE